MEEYKKLYIETYVDYKKMYPGKLITGITFTADKFSKKINDLLFEDDEYYEVNL